MKQNNIKSVVHQFTTQLNADHRYRSFDYCYNYFLETDADQLLLDKEKSCLVLGFYLASWGMYRGSSFLLQEKNLTHFKSVVEYISKLKRDHPDFWGIDVDNYDKNIPSIIDVYKEVKQLLVQNQSDLTLVTKILLGVFGFIPAYDSFFCNSFREIYKAKCGFRSVNKESLGCIQDFYFNNQEVIDKLSEEIYTINFENGKNTKIKYTKAKIIDMYGFNSGMQLKS